MLVILISFVVGFSAYAKDIETKSFDAKTIRKVEIDNSSGLVTVVGADVPKATVEIEKIRFGEKCHVEFVQTGSTLLVKISRDKLAIGVDCKANASLTIPKNASVGIASGAGNIDVSGMTREVEFKVGSGDVKIDGKLEELEGKSGSGYVTFTGAATDIELMAGSGEIKVQLTSPPEPGKIDIKTGSGNAAISMPSMTDVYVSSLTAGGSVQNEFAINKNAKLKINFKSGSGNLSVKKTDLSSSN